jgi:outer membrane protein OmpA-like peptidoglycan-associated protein
MNFKRLSPIVFGGLLLLSFASPSASAQNNSNQTPNPAPSFRSVPSGAKMKFRGVVIDRNADTFTIRDRSRADYQVRITDDTSVPRAVSAWRQKYPTGSARGLIVEVEGRRCAGANLWPKRSDSASQTCALTDTRDTGRENRRKSGQIDELYAVAQEARQEVARVDARVSALDDYDVQESIAVTFRLNSAVLLPEARHQLDDFATKALASSGYMIEVSGHTDSTGSDTKNMRLSRDRAESVVEYLTVNHKIPARRFITPMGYGKSDAVANNSTASGRAQNRRVEVKILANRGLRGNAGKTSSARP